MRTKIYATGPYKNHVTIEYFHPILREMDKIEISVPLNGGYVRFESGGQVCWGLESRGSTLRFTNLGGDNFLNYIRNHWRIYRRNLMKEAI